MLVEHFVLATVKLIHLSTFCTVWHVHQVLVCQRAFGAGRIDMYCGMLLPKLNHVDSSFHVVDVFTHRLLFVTKYMQNRIIVLHVLAEDGSDAAARGISGISLVSNGNKFFIIQPNLLGSHRKSDLTSAIPITDSGFMVLPETRGKCFDEVPDW